jgi:hypothetical protein
VTEDDAIDRVVTDPERLYPVTTIGEALPAPREIVESKSVHSVPGGLAVDLFTASAIVSVHDALGDTARAKFVAMNLLQGQDLVFKVIARLSSSRVPPELSPRPTTRTEALAVSQTTDTTPEIMPAQPLTSEDLTALRMANEHSLHTNSHVKGSVLRLYTQAHGDPAVFTKRQQVLFPETHTYNTRVRTIVIDGSASGYGDGDGGGWRWPSWPGAHVQEPFPACFFSGYQHDEWSTIVRTLRAGTVLKVIWTADNNTEIAREANLHLDTVRLVATTGKRVNTFNVGWAAGRNNSARMIQRQRSPSSELFENPQFPDES